MLEASVQLWSGQSEQSGGPGLVATSLLECPSDVLAFDAFDDEVEWFQWCREWRAGSLSVQAGAEAEGQVLDINAGGLPISSSLSRLADDGIEFIEVAGPEILPQCGPGRLGQSTDLEVCRLVVLFENVLCEGAEIIRTIAEGRERNGDRRQPVMQFGKQPLGVDSQLGWDGRRGHQPHCGMPVGIGVEPIEELLLDVAGELVDLGQEEGAGLKNVGSVLW